MTAYYKKVCDKSYEELSSVNSMAFNFCGINFYAVDQGQFWNF